MSLEVKRDRDGAGETSCSPGLSWREGPGGIRGNCPAGLPAPLPSGGGASGPPVCVCGGVQDHPPGLAGERAPCSGLASPGPFESSRGRRPLPQDVLPGWRWGQLSEPLCSPEPPLPTLVRDPAGCQGGPRPSRRLRRPPRCVRTRARWGCVPGAGGGTRGSGFTSPGPRQVRVDGSLAKWSVSPSQGDLPAWGTLSATEPILESPEISGSESLHCLSASTLGRHPGPSDGAVQSGRWAGAAWTAVQTGRARATRGEARPPRVGPGLGRQAGPGDRLHLTLPRVPWRKRC